MTPRTRKGLGLFVLVALLGPLLVDWLWVSDEERVGRTLDAIEAAFEAHDADGVLDWFAADVQIVRPVPGLAARGTVAERVRGLLGRARAISIRRDETKLDFPESGEADVVTEGIGFAAVDGFGEGPFRFEMELRLRKADDGRFLLQSVERVTIRPVLG